MASSTNNTIPNLHLENSQEVGSTADKDEVIKMIKISARVRLENILGQP